MEKIKKISSKNVDEGFVHRGCHVLLHFKWKILNKFAKTENWIALNWKLNIKLSQTLL